MPVLPTDLDTIPRPEPASRPRLALLAMPLLVVGLGFGGCAQRPQEVAAAAHGREYFPSSIYGAASRRVVADGQPIPHGGGQYLVGKPYTIAGRTYYPSESKKIQVGNASWYGDAFHGRLTANGEIYDRDGFTAASPTMPLPSYARVTNLRNNYSMIVRVNDRGPYASDRIMDVSRRVAESLDFKRYGTAKIKVEYVARASLAGSDDTKLFATLRTNGPARWEGEPTMVAEAPVSRPRVASLSPYVPETDRTEAVETDPRNMRRTQRLAEVRRPNRAPLEEAELEDRRGLPKRHAIAAVEPGSRWRREVQSTEDDRPVPTYRGQSDRAMPTRAISTRAMSSRAMSSRVIPSAYTMPARTTRAKIAEAEFVPPRSRLARTYEPATPRVTQVAAHRAMLPPSRPMDLGTIPGAGSQIRARHDAPHLRLARARDD